MLKLVKLKKDCNIKKPNQLKEYLNPEFIFLPLKDNNLNLSKQEVKKEEKILSSLISPISGTIIGTKNMINIDKEIKTLVIKNNYKEELFQKKNSNKNINKMTKNDFFSKLSNMQIDSAFLNQDYNSIIIRGFDNELYIENNYYYLQKYSTNILETIDALMHILKIRNGTILLKDNYPDLIINYTKLIGIYPNINIKIIGDLYPLENDKILKEEILNKKDKDDILILSIDNVINIYNAIKRNRYTTEKFITITGNAINESYVINTKIGSSAKEIINNIVTIKEKDINYIINNILCCVSLKSIDNLIVTEDLKGIIINKNEKVTPSSCINCGKCYKVCPEKLDPKNIDAKKCIKCGLCSYYCPAKINLLERISDKNE